MEKQFAFFYLMKKEPERIKLIVPQHVEYWRSKRLAGYSGGPFSDRSGGLITFEAGSIEIASDIVKQDPFILNSLLENSWLKEWIIEEPKG